jgi:hypothetical protein
MELKTILMINNAFDVDTMNSAHETHIKVSAPLSILRLLVAIFMKRFNPRFPKHSPQGMNNCISSIK